MAVTAGDDARDTVRAAPEPPSTLHRRQSFTAVLRQGCRHWPLAVLLVAGVALRVISQLAYRPALLYIDSPKYLIAGLEKYDPQGYRVLVIRPLTWIGNLATVAAFQHLLGLAMAVALYVVLVRHRAPRWAATLAAAPVLLDAYQLQMEQTIMPDVLFEAFIVAGLTILVWHPRPSPVAISVAGFVLGASATVRQVGEILIIPVLLVCVLAARGWRSRLGHGALVTVSFLIPIMVYMTYSSLTLGDGFELSDQGDAVLYGRAAAAADCTTLQLTAAEQAVCPTPATARSLGVDGLVNNPASPAYAARLPAGVSRPLTINSFSFAVLEQQPLRVTVAIGRDAVKLFALTRNTSPGDTPIWRWQFQDDYPTYPEAVTTTTAAQMFAAAGGGGGPVAARPLAVFLRDYQLHGGWTPGPVLLASLLAGVAGVAAGRRRGGGHPAALVCLLVSGLGVAALLGADLYEFSWRYQLPALVTLPAGGALGIAAIRARLRPPGAGSGQAQARVTAPARRS
ncbi:MAG TPA: phospholipid carrier-dependent glycosyltransferase [Streptosporangiaceae bacterium]